MRENNRNKQFSPIRSLSSSSLPYRSLLKFYIEISQTMSCAMRNAMRQAGEETRASHNQTKFSHVLHQLFRFNFLLFSSLKSCCGLQKLLLLCDVTVAGLGLQKKFHKSVLNFNQNTADPSKNLKTIGISVQFSQKQLL